MSYVEYEKAQKAGLKAFKSAISKGENAYLPVLDEILENVDIQSEVNLGLVQIPLENVVGTSNAGRTYAFANNFMPILDYKTEFGSKWSTLCDSQIEEGIRDPIKVYEYLNKYYVVEGNKRVSVLKYFDAVNVSAQVTRKVPKLTDDKEIKIYYEFMDFYKLTEINYISFSHEGFFKRLLELTSENPDEPWTDDQKKDFGSFNHNFCVALKAKGGEKLPMTMGDALLLFLDVYGYENAKEFTGNEIKEKIDKLWEEYLIESSGREVSLKLDPPDTGKRSIMSYFKGLAPKQVKVAFIFDKDIDESDWLYGHELGRLYLEEHCSERIKTLKVHNLNSEEDIITAMEDLITMGVKIIFTTSSRQVNASLKVAVNHPDTVILNCSLNTSHKLISTYYARLYEVKFLSGILAGALTTNDKIGYLADYPILGITADINAFALGVAMVNPDAKVYLEWISIKGVAHEAAIENFRRRDINYISDQIMIKPREAGRRFGLYYIDEKGTFNIAMPIYQWGVFYEKLINTVLQGKLKEEEKKDNKAVNYWWGLSAEVVDLIYSDKIPPATLRLVKHFKNMMKNNEFYPFDTVIKDQNGVIRNEDNEHMLPEDIMKMNWLAENVVGEIPEIDELKDSAKSIVELKGVGTVEDKNDEKREADKAADNKPEEKTAESEANDRTADALPENEKSDNETKDKHN